MLFTYSIHQLSDYINWIYFFHAWGFAPRFSGITEIHGCDACRSSWITSFPEKERPKALEAVKLYQEAIRLLKQLDRELNVQTLFKLCRANSDGDNLILEEQYLFPLLRQQTRKKPGEPLLCLSDFVRPLSGGIPDKTGLFAASVGTPAEADSAADPYRNLLVQTLSDRLAEAAVEKTHEKVRKEIWGYAPDEKLTLQELFLEKFQGIRPAVGYPSLPDQSVNFIINEILDLQQIGIALTENGAMHPHSSVSGLMFAHPASRYFSVGKIGEDQLADYAARRGYPVNQMKKFLTANL